MANAKERSKMKWLEAQKLGKAKVRPQDEFPKFMAHRQRLNRLERFPYDNNPFYDAIVNWKPDNWLFEERENDDIRPAEVVAEAKHFAKMMEHIRGERVLMVDFEGHNVHSFLGMTMTIQISTYERSFIIHIPSCIEEILTELKVVFESDKIVKIMHGASNDILNLQRDFCFFPKAVVDTQFVYNYCFGVTEPGFRIGFKTMAKELLRADFPADLKAEYQLADWRIFPLPKMMQKYAQYDTKLLVKCWEILKLHFWDGMWENSPVNPFRLSNLQTATIYKLKTETPFSAAKKHPEAYQDFVMFSRIHWWRENRARAVDESPNEVMSMRELLALTKARPKTEDEMRTVFTPHAIPRWVRQVKDELLNFLVTPVGKEQEKDEVMNDDDEEILIISAPMDIDLDLYQTTLVPSERDMEIVSSQMTTADAPSSKLNSPVKEKEEEIQTEPLQIITTLKRVVTIPEETRVVRDVSSFVRLPMTYKKWTSNPPGMDPIKRSQGQIVRKRKQREPRPEGQSRNRIPLTAERKSYGRRRRQHNLRRNRQLKKHGIIIVREETSSPGGTSGGGMCGEQSHISTTSTRAESYLLEAVSLCPE